MQTDAIRAVRNGWLTVLNRILAVGFVCSLLAACGDSGDVLDPNEPSPQAVSLTDLFGNVLLKANGYTVNTDSLESLELIAIYFEANWCPACAAFTPLLVNTYSDLQLAGRSFEVVFASFDVNTQELLDHMTDKGMPWLAVPPDGGKIAGLAQRYTVQFIPMVVVIDSEGNTITAEGRDDVVTSGALAYDDWLAGIGGT